MSIKEKSLIRDYHLIFIFSANQSRPMEKLQSLFEQHQVQINMEDVEEWGEKPLYTPIRKEEHGVFVVASGFIPPSALSQLNKDLKVRPEILHHMIKRIDPPKKEKFSETEKQ